MEEKNHQFISLTYRLYTQGKMGRELVEEAPVAQPFQFVSGFGYTLDAFEKNVIGLEAGANFDFELKKEEAYGDLDPAHIIDLDRDIFTINGHFDHERIYKDAMVPLQNEDGNRFYGKVLDITDDKVKMDLNHPLAGKTLNFKGRIIENRKATNEEIQHLINHMTGEECGCGCNDCGGGCGNHHHDHDEHHDHCGCGHCQH